MPTADVERYRGRWVAVNRFDDTVAEAAETLEELHRALDQRPGLKVLIHRVPTLDEPIFVGLG